MELMDEIEALIQQIRSAKNVPFSASAMVDRQALLDRLEALRERAPDELKQARWMMRDRNEMMGRAQKEADQVISEARVERDRLVSRTEIVQAANREADKIIEEAKARAREIRIEAEDYVDAKLASFEVVLQKTLAAVAKGRESLRGRLDLGAAEEPQELPAPPDELPRPGHGHVRVRPQ
jgi:cell division septum initiation protein DivIVA